MIGVETGSTQPAPAASSDAGSQSQGAPAGEPGPKDPAKSEVRRILDLSVTMSVILATKDLTVDSILDLAIGSIIEFDVPFDTDLTVAVGNHEIGRGQAVKLGENFGLRFTSLGNVHDRIDALKGSA